ncbi:MAG: cytochrome c [Alphaproteobacteria bacterium]|nr:MAG: cytochrome c [Alphaproteobacteria bacterium]
MRNRALILAPALALGLLVVTTAPAGANGLTPSVHAPTTPVPPVAPQVHAPSAPHGAAETIKDPVAYRQGVMKEMGKAMGALGKGFKDDKATAADLLPHAEHLAALSHMPWDQAFPAGTAKGQAAMESKASSKIWTDKKAWQAEIKEFQESTAKLVTVLKSGDKAAAAKQMETIGKISKSSHGNFIQH